MRDIFPILA